MGAGGDISRNLLPETVEVLDGEQSQNNTTMQTSVFFDEDLVRDQPPVVTRPGGAAEASHDY